MNSGDKLQFIGIRNLDLQERYRTEKYDDWLNWATEDNLISGKFYKFSHYSYANDNKFIRLKYPNDQYEYPIFFFKTPKEQFYEEVLNDN